MRIALDASALTGPFTGDRTYWRNLIGALAKLDGANEYLLYSRSPIPETDVPTSGSFKCRCIPAVNARTWSMLALPRAVKQDGADLLHVQYTVPPRVVRSCKVITTVHDVSFRLHPEWFGLRDRLLMNITVPMSMRSARFVITDSVSSRNDIQRLYRLAEDKLVAIPLGLPAGFEAVSRAGDKESPGARRDLLAGRYGLSQPFILAIGVLQPRKNLKTVAAAYGALVKRWGPTHRLVLVGKAGWLTGREEILREAERVGGGAAREGVLFPGYVPDDELAIWYNSCDVFVHPALYEGFGFPPLEAMACAAPVIVSDAPALPEVVGDAALVVPATDVEAWTNAIHRVLTEPGLAQDLRSRGPARAARFNWAETAKQTAALYSAAI